MIVNYDALLVVSFGGPEGREDVIPFLENVLRGRNVPRERMLAVTEHYNHFAGVSPINAQNRALIAALQTELAGNNLPLPIYLGNRNWHPLLPDTLRKMAEDGVRRALALFTSAFSSYSGCRQYRENIAAAQQQVGPAAPEIDKLRAFFNHPGFVEPLVELLTSSLAQISAEHRVAAAVVFTAHSIPLAMAATCQYEAQLHETSRLVGERTGLRSWQLAYQSRSGPPNQPWLEPDIGAVLRELRTSLGVRDVVIVPVGFVSDHLEVMYDLDVEAKQICDEIGLNMVRCPTVGTHPRFVTMIRELVVERLSNAPQRLTLGRLGPCPDVCPADCCRYEPRRPTS